MSIQVHETGSPDAPTIVFLHALGLSSWMWTEQIAALQEHYHCLAIDLPGNGDSYQTEWHSFADTAVQVADIIRAKVPGGKAHVVGLSLGGFVALHVLRDHPDVVDSLVISGVATRTFPNKLMWHVLIKTVMPALLITRWGSSLMAKTMQLPSDAAALYKRDSQRLTRQTVERIYREIIVFNLPPAFSRRSQRVLAAAGEHDVAMIKNGLQDYLSLLPNSAAAIAPGAHHGWNGEQPELFTAMIRAWIEHKPLPSALVRVEPVTKPTQVVAPVV